MKALCLKDMNSCENLIDKLFSLIDRINPDIIICLGGFFQENTSQSVPNEIKPISDDKANYGIKPKKSMKKNEKQSVIGQTVVLEQLAIFGLPVLLIPNTNDLRLKFAVKRAKNTENILYRWLDNKITSIEGWMFLGLSDNNLISQYKSYGIFSSNSILCSTDDPNILERSFLDDPNLLPQFLLLSDDVNPLTIPNITCYQLTSLTKDKINFIDFSKNFLEEIKL